MVHSRAAVAVVVAPGDDPNRYPGDAISDGSTTSRSYPLVDGTNRWEWAAVSAWSGASAPDRPVAVGHYVLGIEQAARRRLPAQLLNARQSAAFYLRDFSTSNASWWNGGDCSELSLHGGNGMPSALGADVGSAVVSYGATAGKEASEPVRGTVAAARAVGAEVNHAGRFKEAREFFEQVALAEDFIEFLTLPAYPPLD